MEKKRLFSGIKPSGDLHIGNYLGAIRQWVALQEQFDAFFCIVDLHAITVSQKPEDLRRRTLEIAKMYLTSGIDPNKATLFVQSHVSEHAELSWVLNTIAKNGDLTKMTQFKDKSGIDLEAFDAGTDIQVLREWKEKFNSVGVGLFDYPVLQAADILLYDTEVVPVGEDQVQHIELARTLARRFNKNFGDTFVIPQAVVQQSGARIMALDNPAKKMSKSAVSELGYIALMDAPEEAKKKIMRAVTDSGSDITASDDHPAMKNLLTIFSLFSGKTIESLESSYKGKGYAEFKQDLGVVVAEFLESFQKRYTALSDDAVRDVLRRGAERAKSVASKKHTEVKEKVGFLA